MAKLVEQQSNGQAPGGDLGFMMMALLGQPRREETLPAAVQRVFHCFPGFQRRGQALTGRDGQTVHQAGASPVAVQLQRLIPALWTLLHRLAGIAPPPTLHRASPQGAPPVGAAGVPPSPASGKGAFHLEQPPSLQLLPVAPSVALIDQLLLHACCWPQSFTIAWSSSGSEASLFYPRPPISSPIVPLAARSSSLSHCCRRLLKAPVP